MSTVKVDTIKTTGNVEVYTCKAWVNFNCTGTPAIRASGNVSSITDLAVGKYTMNFSNDMPDVNYARVASMGMSGGFYANAFDDIHSPTTSGFTIGVRSGATYYDIAFIHASVFR